jgi:hypothetical protein
MQFTSFYQDCSDDDCEYDGAQQHDNPLIEKTYWFALLAGVIDDST